ncbi:MAG: hypothetical protein COS99_06990 [Candidatus Omnitrophica bacterium CG07_land_8_20_14_0_80_42_15]|uniref:Methyltransferase domain-containing protein n=1 Tax=Candidatus Aquitaenariimonas noxiae TaxID=1974741 RepID=A0A2J0L1E5_9BACT|nr:MAG: hypothetical protein COS99_06990 [Candidatus Omnitrophica bacterium CG07_land_8_20_14_0_80_42_15]
MLNTSLIEVLECPSCKGNLTINDAAISCCRCGESFLLSKNVVDFRNKNISNSNKIGHRFNAKEINKYGRFLLNPVSSPFSPLTLITKYRITKYYKDILGSETRASKFFNYYLEKADLQKNDIVLDYGCGKGRISAMMSLLGFRVIGCDIFEDAFRYQIKNSLFYLQNPQVSFYIKNESINLAIDYLVINNIPELELENYLAAIQSKLKEKGYFLLVSANPKSYGAHIFYKYTSTVFSPELILSHLRKLKFKINIFRYDTFYAPFFPLLINWFRLVLRKEFEMFDYNSRLASLINPEKRGVFVILAQK